MSIAPLTFTAAADVPARSAPSEHFTGTVQMEPLARPESFQCETLRVSFLPGARTDWHTHPVGQILLVTSGNGLIATRDGARRMTIGDVVTIPAGVEHWHGGAEQTPCQHVAIQPGGQTQWLESVSDADFAAAVTAADA